MNNIQTANSGYNKISHVAGQLSDISVSDGNFANISAGSVNTQSVNIYGSGYTRQTVVGYVPTEFSTAAPTIGTHLPLPLLSAPGLSAAMTANDPFLVKLPAKSIIIRSIASNNGTEITTGVRGTNIWTNTSIFYDGQTEVAGTPNNVFNGATAVEINNIFVRTSDSNITPDLTTPDNTFVVTNVLGGFEGEITGGDLKMVIEYMTV